MEHAAYLVACYRWDIKLLWNWALGFRPGRLRMCLQMVEWGRVTKSPIHLEQRHRRAEDEGMIITELLGPQGHARSW